MNFSFKELQLERIALVKVSALLWNQSVIRNLVIEFLNSPLFVQLDCDLTFRRPQGARRKEWQKIEDKVLENALQLMIPPCLKEKIVSIIQAVGFQILKWLEYHRKFCKLDLDLPNEFCWTPQGSIDKKETSKFLIKDETIDAKTRYQLACFYCIRDNIRVLYNKLSRNDRRSLYNNENTRKCSKRSHLDFWVYKIKGTLNKFLKKYNCGNSCYKYMLECATYNGNKAATEYFLKRIRSGEVSLVNIALNVANKRQESFPAISLPPKEYLGEVLCFLLSQMNLERQMKVFTKHHFKVMCSLLDWPFQSFYIKAVNDVLNYCPDIKYDTLLRYIIHKANLGYKDYAYSELFRDFWQTIPDVAKNRIINGLNFASLLHMLFWIKDRESLKFILQSATVIQKHDFIFSGGGKNACEDLVFDEEWDSIRLILKSFISSKDEMVRFKDQFEAQLQEGRPRIIEKFKIDKCCGLLSDMVKEYDKRKCTGDGDCRPAKRLCCIEFNDA